MKNKNIYSILIFAILTLSKLSFGQVIYEHNFTATFTAVNPYTVAPNIIDANLNSSQWATNLASGFTTAGGATNQALNLSNSNGSPTYTLSYNVAVGFKCDISAFSFWSKRSNTGASNWTLTVNGTTVGAGTTPTAGIATGTVPVSSAVNGLTGIVNVVLTLSGGTSTLGTYKIDDFALYGNVYSTCTPPTTQATSLVSSSITTTSADLSWTAGSGGNVIVLAHQASAVNALPISGTAYTANSAFSLGQQIGAGNYVVYNGTGTSVNVTGLSPSTSYYFSVFEYTTNAGTPCYLTPGLTGNITTATVTAGGCFEIQSILVDACDGANEGQNEMVLFQVGNLPLSVSTLTVNWPANTWRGVCQNAGTAADVNTVNATITSCGLLVEPVGGVLKANSKVLLVTGTQWNPLAQSFVDLNDTLTIIFQCFNTGNTGGHFGNYTVTPTPDLRTLVMGFSPTCNDNVTYNRNLLIKQNQLVGQQDGGAVEFTPTGAATYVNHACKAPYIPLTVNAGGSVTACFNGSKALTAVASGSVTTVNWSLGAGATGVFAPTNALSTTYTPGAGENGTVILSCTIARICGTHTVTAVDNVTMTILQLPTANIGTSNSYSLCPSATSVMSYTVTNPTFASVVSPSWSSPAATTSTYMVSSPSGTTPVTYSLNLANTCGSTSKTFTVYPLELPTVALSATTPTACVGSVVTLTATSNTGNFSWTNPVSTNSTVAITANTTTTGIVTSTNSCGPISATYTLTVTQNPTLTVDNPSPTLCAGQSATITANTIAGTYTWMPGSINTNSIVVSAAGTHTVFTSNVCNSASVAVNVTFNATPTLSISTTSNSLCAGGQTTSTLSLVGSTGSYTWSTGANTSTIAITTPGAYSATVNAGTCGTTSASINISTLITPTISVASTSTLLCNGATATLTASSNLSNFSWSNGATNTPTIAVTTTGLYTVSVSNVCGVPSKSVNILADATPTLNLVSNTLTLCPSPSSLATLTVTGGIQPYTWSNSTSTGSIVTTSGGTVSVSYTNACGTDTKYITVSVIPNPTVTLVTNLFTACPGDVINVIANSSAGNYSWSGSANTTATLVVTASTSTTGTVTTTNACNVSATDTYTINVTPAPTFTINSPNSISLCTGQSAIITATSSTGSYTWMPGGSNTNSLSVNATGDYTVFTSNACTKDSIIVSVSVNSSPTLTITSTTPTLCLSGQTATLSLSGSTGSYVWSNGSGVATTSVSAPGVYTATVTTASCGTTSASFTINAIDTPTISLTSSSSLLCNGASATLTASSNMANEIWSNLATNTNSIVVNTSGTYTVGVSNACGTPTASINIQTNTTPTLNLTASSLILCPNQSATLTVTGGSSPYVWSNSASTGSIVTTTGGSVSVTYSNSCGTSTQAITVATSSLNAGILANPTTGTTPLTVNFSNGSVGAISYVWTFGNGNTANTQTVVAQTYTTVGNFMAYLLATDGTCFDRDSVLINVLNEEATLVIPNVFTPNNDNINDTFRISSSNNITEFNCVVFDRWGLQMFAWSDLKGGWDGTVGGKSVPAATYFYIINAKDINEKEIKKEGTITLFR